MTSFNYESMRNSVVYIKPELRIIPVTTRVFKSGQLMVRK